MRAVVVTTIGPLSTDIVIRKYRESGMRVIGYDVCPGEWVTDAENVDAFYQVPYTSNTDHYIETVLSICRKEGAKAVIPLTDTEIDVFSLHHHEFGEVNAALCISDEAYIGLYRDKMGLYRYLEKHMKGTAIPAVRLEDADLDEVSYPTVCKPYNGGGNQDLRFVGSRREMERFPGKIDPADYIA